VGLAKEPPDWNPDPVNKLEIKKAERALDPSKAILKFDASTSVVKEQKKATLGSLKITSRHLARSTILLEVIS